MQKTCFKCLLPLPRSEFYPHPSMSDGLMGKCKTCTKKDVAEREARLKETDPVWVRKERERHRLKSIKARLLGTASPKNPETKKKWCQANRIKVYAQRKAAYAQRRGIIVKPVCCSSCDLATGRLHKHHPDYSKPLDVVWLCPKCHGFVHRLKD